MREHYDVAIAGFWYGANYGSLLNGYAMYRTIKSFGKEVLMLNKPNASASDVEITKGHNVRFVKKYYDTGDISPILPYSRLEEVNDICDCFCAGSDQIWNYNISFHENMYLPFVREDKKIISFATSFGHKIDATPNAARPRIRKYLHRYSAISVREQFDVDILRENYGIKGELVFEPVFCIDKCIYDELADNSSFNETEPYLLTYILDPTPQKREAIKFYSEQKKLKVINILNGTEWMWERNKQLLDLPNILENVGVEDFLKAFRGASCVITDSFHGSAFSIIFQKPFFAIGNYARGYERFIDLFGRLKLMDRLVSDPKNIPLNENLLKPVDYTETNQIIAAEAKRTVEWVRSAVETPKSELPDIRLSQIQSITNLAQKTFWAKDLDKSVLNKLDMERCTGCSACGSVCPVNAIEMKMDGQGFIKPTINGKCTNCGLCATRCIALNPTYKNSLEPKCYAMTADNEIRKISSSGGMFSVAAEYIIDKGGYVCGAAFNDDFSVRHIIINDKNDLQRLRGSKYIQSQIGESYKEVKGLLDNGKLVLFSGMPCQVAGLHSYLNKEYENLYTMDLFCHGITSYKVFNKYHKDVHGSKPLKALGFKEKEPWGWHAGINAYFEDGTHYAQPLETDPYYRAYLGSISKNTTCGICSVNRLPRQGDLTIGDFWGINKCDPQMNDGKGTSAVLINSEKGEKFFKELMPKMQKYNEEPLSAAIAGNGIITHPYTLHKNRNLFFEYFNLLPFDELTNACRDSRLYEKIYCELTKTVQKEDLELFWLAKTAAQLSKGRKIVTWIRSAKFENILFKYFGKTVAFGVSARNEMLTQDYIEKLNVLNKQSEDYFLVSLDRNYDNDCYRTLNNYGYEEEKDFIFRICKPIAIENFDLSKGTYFDNHGNTIEGKKGVVGRVIFSGGNNHIIIGDNVAGTERLNIRMTHNGLFKVGDNTKFAGDFKVELNGTGGHPFIRIGKNCYFNDALIRIYNDRNSPSVTIGDSSSFSYALDLHANQGKKIIIGKDCMFSNNDSLWAGDGHTIFDVKTGKVKNLTTGGPPSDKDFIIIGNHVWVGKDALLLSGTHIGDGSIIAARSIATKGCSNNCSIGGSPAKLLSTDVAWSGRRNVTEMEKFVKPEYALPTSAAKMPVSGRNVLVIGGTGNLGSGLVELLLERGNRVTVATRGIKKDTFGMSVDRAVMDVYNYDDVKNALAGKYFDIIFNVLMISEKSARSIIDNCRYGKYIQLSSAEVYLNNAGVDTKESALTMSDIRQRESDPTPAGIKDKQLAEKYILTQGHDVSVVRIPRGFVDDDLMFYCRSIMDSVPISTENASVGFSLVRNTEIIRFLPWIAAQDHSGPINLASEGMVTINMIIDRIEKKVGRKAVLSAGGEKASENLFSEAHFSLCMDKAKSLGYNTSDVNTWLWSVVDNCIDRASKGK